MPINNPEIPSMEAWGSSAYYPGIYPHVVTKGSSNYYQPMVVYHGLSSNQTLDQQGLTANVSCRSQNLSDPTSFPYTILSNSTYNVSGSGLDWPSSLITSWSWNTTCSDSVFSCRPPFDLRNSV